MQNDNIIANLPEFHNEEEAKIETLILAGVVSNPELLSVARRTLNDSMFSNQSCLKVWKTLTAMEDAKETIDAGTIYHKSTDKRFIKIIIASITEAPFSEPAMEDYCTLMRDNFIKRSCYMSGIELIKKSLAPAVEGQELVAISNQLQSILSDNMVKASKNESIHDVFKQLARTLEEQARKREQGIDLRVTTGIPSLDFLFYGGFNGGDLVILAARPSVGKTAVMLQFAMAAGRAGKKPVLFNLEMTNSGLAQRMITSTHLVSQYEIAKAKVNWKSFSRAVDSFSGAEIILNDFAKSLEEIVANMTILVKQGKCNAAFIDYAGLVDLKGAKATMTEKDRLTVVTKKLKQVAKELDIPVVLLSQLNRSSAQENRSPQLFDLRDSGSLEQDADIVLMLENADDEKLREAMGDECIKYNAEKVLLMWVRKNRQGQRDICIPLVKDECCTKFTEAGKEPEPEPVVEDDDFGKNTFEDDGLPF